MKWPEHGGQPNRILELHGIIKGQSYYDFSANINPLGPPEQVSESLSEVFTQFDKYPDPHYEQATKLVAIQEHLLDEQVLLTNGGSEAIFLVAQLFTGKKALIIEPTFSEYKRASEVYGLSVSQLSLNQDFSFPLEKVINKIEEIDIVFLCRPNNPTGTVVDFEDIRVILEKGLTCQTTIVVDEAFIHFLPTEVPDLSGLIERYPNLILLRSLTKIYAIPSLRLGYVTTSMNTITRLKKNQIPWSINGVVIALLPTIFKQTVFVDETKLWLQKQLAMITSELTNLGFYYSPTLVNFYLLKDQDQQVDTEHLLHFLLANNIIPRHTHTFYGLEGRYLRFAVRSEQENTYLLDILRRWKQRS